MRRVESAVGAELRPLTFLIDERTPALEEVGPG